VMTAGLPALTARWSAVSPVGSTLVSSSQIDQPHFNCTLRYRQQACAA
jgi:hypothetical protein